MIFFKYLKKLYFLWKNIYPNFKYAVFKQKNSILQLKYIDYTIRNIRVGLENRILINNTL